MAVQYITDILITLILITTNLILYTLFNHHKQHQHALFRSTHPSTTVYASLNQHIATYRHGTLALILTFTNEFDIFHWAMSHTDASFVFTGYVRIDWLNCYVGQAGHALLRWMDRCKAERMYYGMYRREVAAFCRRHRPAQLYITFIPDTHADTDMSACRIYVRGSMATAGTHIVDDLFALIDTLEHADVPDRTRSMANALRRKVQYEMSRRREEENITRVEEENVRRRERENVGYGEREVDHKIRPSYARRR